MASSKRRETYFVDIENNPCANGNCSTAACYTYCLDLHKLTVMEFYSLITAYFDPYNIPVPKIFSMAEIQSAVNNRICENNDTITFQTSDSVVSNDITLLPNNAIFIDSNYSVSLFKAILAAYPNATEFQFYKGYNIGWQNARIVFLVKDANQFLYYCDYSGIEP